MRMKMGSAHATREGWLAAGAEMLAERVFAGDAPPVRCSCGFARGSKKAVGQCFGPENSADGSFNLFVCPTVDEPVRVLDILAHEMVHAVVGTEAKHRGPFRELALKIGLEGKMTATRAGPELRATLEGIAEDLGSYPHAAVVPTEKEKVARKKWPKYRSARDPEYRLDIAPAHVERCGAPRDPWGEEMLPEADEDVETPDDEARGDE